MAIEEVYYLTATPRKPKIKKIFLQFHLIPIIDFPV